MSYAAVTSLMETLSLNFLESQPPFPLEDLAAQIRDHANQNLGILQQIVEVELDEATLKGWMKLHGIFNNGAVKQSDYPKKKKQLLLAECSSQNERITNELREVGEVKQKIVSLHQNLGLLQQSLEKSEIPYDDARVRVMKDLEAQIRDASFKAEERIEMELSAIYLTKESLLHVTDCLLRLHQIFNKAEKQTDYRIRDGNENRGLLQQIVEAQIREMASSKRLRKKTCLPRLYGKQQLPRLRELGEVKQKMLSLQENLGLLQEQQDILTQKSEIGNDNDAGAMKDYLEAETRDVWFKAEERIEMELSAIYLAKDSLLHITDCLLRLHEILIEAQKQTDYHRNELIRIQTAQVSLLGRIRRWNGLLHKRIIVSNFSKKASNFDGGMVGCEKLFEKVLDQLLTQQTTKGRQVVSIVGMGGIGQTTLAHKLYQHPSITSHFDKRAWVTVSQEYNVEQMLRCLLSCVSAASRDELQSIGQDQLAERLRKHLKEQRYLIVMDDIWSITAWDSVQRCFPDDNNGSRILLTSRLKEVAEYTCSGNTPINMPFLDADESWNLYCKVFGKTEFLLVFEQIGRDIVKKCKGLPLAITIVASLLSKIEEEEKWKNVAKTVMGDSSDACSRILYLSYNQLPHHLKACFLYFAIFEEDYEISVKELVRLWAAEGLLRTVKHVNLEKVAMECLQDLVDRSLVIASKHSYNGKMKRIRIHDLLRDLCLREAKFENLWNVNGVHKPCRWISHTSRLPFYRIVRFEDEFFHKSHSFHLSNLYYSWGDHMKLLLSHMKLLRVLDIRSSNWTGVIDLNMLANLVHLRYLALSTYQLSDIKLLQHWNNMQTFIVSGSGTILFSSESYGIWKMPLLKNICIGRIYSLETPSAVHRNLENISWLDFKSCTKDLFTMIPNLKTLGVDGDHYGNSIDWFYNFVHLEQLEKLSIRRWMKFDLDMCSMPWATCLPNLKKLNFLKSNLQWSELNAISMLPNLEVLKLIDACEGSKWETSDGGFRRLKRLVIKKTYLRCWNAVGDHFPMLECLELSVCYLLKEIPSGFADITTLALIRLSKCSDSLLTSAKWIQEEQNNNYGHDALLVHSENIWVSFYPSSLIYLSPFNMHFILEFFVAVVAMDNHDLI